MIPTEKQLARMYADALTKYPREAVYAITDNGLQELENIAEDPTQAFEISPAQVQKLYNDGLRIIVHSHPDGNEYPSAPDMRGQAAAGVPYGIFVVDQGHSAHGYFEFDSAPLPLDTSAPFRHGVTDCYALIRSWYAEQGVTLPEFARGWTWWDAGENLYVDNALAAGFVPVPLEDLRPHDMILITFRSAVPQHGGVYVGDGEILHHVGASKGYDPTRPPVRESIQRYLPYITHVFRHKDIKHADDNS